MSHQALLTQILQQEGTFNAGQGKPQALPLGCHAPPEQASRRVCLLPLELNVLLLQILREEKTEPQTLFLSCQAPLEQTSQRVPSGPRRNTQVP